MYYTVRCVHKHNGVLYAFVFDRKGTRYAYIHTLPRCYQIKFLIAVQLIRSRVYVYYEQVSRFGCSERWDVSYEAWRQRKTKTELTQFTLSTCRFALRNSIRMCNLCVQMRFLPWKSVACRCIVVEQRYGELAACKLTDERNLRKFCYAIVIFSINGANVDIFFK